MTKTPVLLVLGSCLSLQFGAALATQLFPAAGPWAVSTLRLLLAGAVLMILVRPRFHRWQRGQWVAVLAFGLSLGAMNGFFYSSIERIALGTAVTLEFLGPLLLAAVLSRSARDGLAVLLALCGLCLIGVDSLSGEPLDPLGVTHALIAGGFWMAYILANQKVGRLVPGPDGLAVALVLGGLLLAPVGGSGIAVILGDSQLLLLAAGVAFFGSLIPFSLEFAALRRLPAGVFGILLSLEPAFAALVGWLLLGQSPSMWKGAAILLVITASVLTTLRPRRPAPAESGRGVVKRVAS